MRKVKLNNISVTISSGLTPLRSNKTFWENGDVPWLKTEQLGVKNIYDTNEKITKYALKNTSIKFNPSNSLSIAMYGEGKTRGNVSILRQPMTTNQACCNVTINSNEADYEYVYYFLKTRYEKLRSLAAGVRKNLNSSDIRNLEIILPDTISEQKKIVAILASIDSKIEINNKINAELEKLAKLIYDYWFVQFDFPDKNGKPYKSSGGKMVWNKELKRNIPDGWKVVNLLEIADYTNGIACQKYRPINGKSLPVIKIREMHEGLSVDTEFVREDIPEKVIVEDGDVLFSWSASLEVQVWAGGRGGLNQHIFKVTSQIFPRSFYYFQLLDYVGHFRMMAENRKTTMGHITQDHLQQSRIVLPPQLLIEDLDKKIKLMIDDIVLNRKQNQKLSELRDWLLPMLMNGQVKIN